jgi:pre-mRNA-splicing factor SYF1
LQWEPRHIEEFVNYLIQAGAWDEAAIQLVNIVNFKDFVSTNNKTKHDYWMMLCDVVSKHSDQIKSIKVEPILRGGLTKFSDQIGKLWTTLADYYIRLANYDKVSYFLARQTLTVY